MRILMDFEMNREAETFNGIRAIDIEEFEMIRLIPTWNKGNSNGRPDGLYIDLYQDGDTEETCTVGEYVLDGTDAAVTKALENYNKVVNQLLVAGYAKISDFENVEWE